MSPGTKTASVVFAGILCMAATQLPPPSLLENGDARAGESSWSRQRGSDLARPTKAADATIENCDGSPCFVMRNGASWHQRIRLVENVTGKHVVLIARGSSERVHADGNITGLPYLWARLATDPRSLKGQILQGMRLESDRANRWETIYGIFPVPEDVFAVDVMLGQAQRKGTPQNGSAARVKDVEVRFFDTDAAARAYLNVYNAQYEAGKY